MRQPRLHSKTTEKKEWYKIQSLRALLFHARKKKVTGALRTRQILQNCLHACRARRGGGWGVGRLQCKCKLLGNSIHISFPNISDNNMAARMHFLTVSSFVFRTEFIMKCSGASKPPQDVIEPSNGCNSVPGMCLLSWWYFILRSSDMQVRNDTIGGKGWGWVQGSNSYP
jgi:hypothetical protein